MTVLEGAASGAAWDVALQGISSDDILRSSLGGIASGSSISKGPRLQD